jgi:APA family basic amino acid/polyamine antiporter
MSGGIIPPKNPVGLLYWPSTAEKLCASPCACSTARYGFWEESSPADPRSRLIYDEPKFRGYEVMLDVWPGNGASTGAPRPAVVRVHGGAWTRGSRGGHSDWDRWLNGLGYEVFDVEYELLHAYFDPFESLKRSDPQIHGLLTTAPHVAGIPLLIHIPAFSIVMLITWLLLRGARESATANNIMVVIKLMALTLFVAVGATHLHAANYTPFAPNGFRGIHQGAAIVFFAYIGFDAISTAAEETRDPQRNLPIGILGGLAICTLIYVIVGFVLTGMVPYKELAVADPLARALELSGFTTVSWIVALGAVVSMSAVLLVFQYGQPRIFFAMGRDGLLPKWAAHLNPITKVPSTTTIITGLFVALWALVGDAGETYDLTNIGTLFAFILVSIGVLVLRYKEPDRPRPFRVPFVWPVCVLSAAGCLFIMYGLPPTAWERFFWWLVIGLVLYFSYGFSHSKLRASNARNLP